VNLVVRVNYSMKNSGKFVGRGVLDDVNLCNPSFFPALSKAWYDDPGALNLRKTLTCSRCGPSSHAYYYCDDPGCHFGLCYVCYSHERYGKDEPINWPVAQDYMLAPSQSHADGLPHGPAAGSPDLSFVLKPFILVTVHGTAKDGDRGLPAEKRLFDTDNAIIAGYGAYPIRLHHTPSMGHKKAGERVAAIAPVVAGTQAEVLFIHLGCHKVAGGYLVSVFLPALCRCIAAAALLCVSAVVLTVRACSSVLLRLPLRSARAPTPPCSWCRPS